MSDVSAQGHKGGDMSTTQPFRFKGESKPPAPDTTPSTSRHGRDARRHSRRRKSRTRSRSPAHRAHECDRQRHESPRPRSLSPNTAFRESLFDAMADDEGAAYWEGVYGQPIHVYPRPEASGETYEGGDYNNPDVLDADAYAAYVRRKMWEKSHEHILEERARREEAAERRKAEKRQQERMRTEDDYHWRSQPGGSRTSRGTGSFTEDLEAGLKRGEERRAQKRRRTAWTTYTKKWDALSEEAQKSGIANRDGKATDDKDTSAQLPWPVSSGKEKDVGPKAVRQFFSQLQADPSIATSSHQVSNLNAGGSASTPFHAQLKLERIRWHPDKMMQRFAFAIDENSLASITAVFQVVDQMWNEEKSKLDANKR